MDLSKLRKEVNDIDARIVKLLEKRAEVSRKIGTVKNKKKSSIYVPDREKEVYRRIVALSRGVVPEATLKAVYREIMSGSLRLEKELGITYLGPPYTFTHLAALKKFGSSVSYVPCDSITDVFVEVERERADYGVAPIENSIEGAVNHTFDMLIDSPLKICSEIYLTIEHTLVSAGKDIAALKRIYSIPQVFAQCRVWLESTMPGVELCEVSSTTKGAQIAAQEKHAGAIASAIAASQYKLHVLARSIEDAADNTTRFLVLGRTLARPTGDDKTSLMFSVKDKAGALHASLTPFKRHHINMTKIESRPSKKRPWEYYFFADIEGHSEEPKVKKVLQELREESLYLKILGSYPRSDAS